MTLALVLLVLGALVLYAGAEAAVHGATRFARAAGIPAFALGAILFGIDIEGLGAAVTAAGRGDTEIAGGEAFGTVLFLFTAAFGAALVVAREPVPAPSHTMLAAPALGVAAAALAISDRHVSRPEGVLLVVVYGVYLYLVVREGRAVRARAAELEREGGDQGSDHRDGSPARSALLTLAGLAVVYLGAFVLVAGGSRLVTRTDLSAGFVGAAIVGTLASLEEILLEVLPVRRGTPELATGNLFGTLGAFTSGVLGLAALVRPLDLDSAVGLAFLAVAFLYAVVASAFFLRGRAGWGLGAFVLAFWVAWLILAGTR